MVALEYGALCIQNLLLQPFEQSAWTRLIFIAILTCAQDLFIALLRGHIWWCPGNYVCIIGIESWLAAYKANKCLISCTITSGH